MKSSNNNTQKANSTFKWDVNFGDKPQNSKRCLRPAVIVLACIMAFTLLLSGCSASKLAAGFDEEAVKAAAQDIVMALNAGEYEKISNEMVREDLRAALSPEVLANGAETMLNGAGAFIEFEKILTVGQKDKATGEDYAVVVVIAKYESKKIQYTLSFNTNMQIVGFYLK